MYKIVILLFASLLVTSCASMSEITPVGKDTYMMASSSNAAKSGGELKAKLAQKASMFCADHGKLMMLVGFSAEDMAFGRIASAEITFRCLLENDPEYIRPTPEYNNSPGGNTSTGVLLNIK